MGSRDERPVEARGRRAPLQPSGTKHTAGGAAATASQCPCRPARASTPAHLLPLVGGEEHVGGQGALGRIGILQQLEQGCGRL